MERLRSVWLCQAGQATTEYATTLLVVVLVAAALAAFVKGGGLDDVFQTITRELVDKVKQP